ncbi:MAG: hypothetical protein ABI824_18950 [Acidobacteriota bacterium]
MRRSLENIEWRQAEARSALEADAECRRKEIDERYRHERLELRPVPSAESVFEADQGDLDRDAPSLDY